MRRSDISFVLEQAILESIKNPPQPKVNKTKLLLEHAQALTGDEVVEHSLDYLAYHDALQLLHDEFAAHQGVLKRLGDAEQITQQQLDTNGDCIYSQNCSAYVAQDVDQKTEVVIAHHERFVLTRYIAQDRFKLEVGRMTGITNHNNNTDKFFEGKDGILLQPFEITSVVNPNLVKGICVQDAYAQNPLHPCFKHLLTPAPVMGFCLEKNIKQLIGYVVHPKMLYTFLDSFDTSQLAPRAFKLKDLIAMQHDTQSALKLLKHRYRINVDDSQIDRIAKFDDQLKAYSKGTCCIEFPNL